MTSTPTRVEGRAHLAMSRQSFGARARQRGPRRPRLSAEGGGGGQGARVGKVRGNTGSPSHGPRRLRFTPTPFPTTNTPPRPASPRTALHVLARTHGDGVGPADVGGDQRPPGALLVWLAGDNSTLPSARALRSRALACMARPLNALMQARLVHQERLNRRLSETSALFVLAAHGPRC